MWDPLTANSWQTNNEADATQIQWFVSNFHDHLENTAAIGFTNAAGNFEGDDPVLAQSMDGASTDFGFPDNNHINNANMATYPDGTKPHMQMYLTDIQGGQSTGFDSSVIYHEYTHGLVGRSIVDADGVDAAGGAQGGAINEGTADWYALDYLYSADSGNLETDVAASRDVIAAKYTFGNLRTIPTDCLVTDDDFLGDCFNFNTFHAGGYTYADFGDVIGEPEVHADGEIFTQTMWQLRGDLIAKYGTATGIAHARQLYSNGLRLTPPNPTFLDLRNGILQASVAGALGDEADIWAVFAERGMGYFASAVNANDVTPIADFSLPPDAAAQKGTVTGTITNSTTSTPQPGVKVGFAGHDTGVGPELSATSNGSGVYTINDVPAGTYPLLRLRGAGMERKSEANVTVTGGQTLTRNFSLRRNFASSEGGATVSSFTGPDFSSSGCGPGGLIDSDQGSVWGSQKPVPREVVIHLPQAITVGAIEIDPTAGCGDDDNASLGGYTVQTSTNGTTFTTAATGTFTAGDLRRYNAVTLPATKPAGVTHVKLIANSSQSTSGSGAQFVDVTEMRVFAEPGSVATPPTATTQPESAVNDTGATLNGTVNPNGTATDYQFEYGTTTAYGSVIPLTPASAGNGNTAVPVTQNLTNLTPGTQYHYRVVAVRGATRVNGADETFTTTGTPPTPPTVTTNAATALSTTGATLNGAINPNGTATSYQFEYGTTTGYGSVAPAAPASAGSGNAPVDVNAPITGLTPGTVYHFRLVGVRGNTRTNGNDLTFTTPGTLGGPTVTTDPATEIDATAAKLHGTVNPNGAATTMHFDVGFDTTYGFTTDEFDMGSGTTPVSLTLFLSGLDSTTTYHYRAVASNANGTVEGNDVSFTTINNGGGGNPTPTPTPTVTPTVTPTPEPTVTLLAGTAKPAKKRKPKIKVACTVTSGRGTVCNVVYGKAKGKRLAGVLSGDGGIVRGKVAKAAGGRLRLAGSEELTAGAYRLNLTIGKGKKAKRLALKVQMK
jgi:fungalysin metallopeptidase (M36)/carboxypeptidase family protein/F5/8 type C domain-containing protein